MINLSNMVGAARPFTTDMILAGQLLQRGMPPIDLPKLRVPSGAAVRSPVFGMSDVPIQALVLRYEYHERLIAGEIVH